LIGFGLYYQCCGLVPTLCTGLSERFDVAGNGFGYGHARIIPFNVESLRYSLAKKTIGITSKTTRLTFQYFQRASLSISADDKDNVIVGNLRDDMDRNFFHCSAFVD